MRQFWGNAFSYDDKQGGNASAGPASFGFGNVSANGKTLTDFGGFLQQVTDEQVPGDVLSRFALEMTEKLCFFGNSSKCDETDPEMRRVAKAFQDSTFKFDVLIRELFSSPLVTNADSTQTAVNFGATVSVLRRDQFCQALSNRLGVSDICDIETPTPTGVTSLFGRDLAGTAKVSARNGRDHFGNHSCMVMIGKNVLPGVTGGCTPLNAAFVASDIDSATGASKASGGDIPRADTHIAAAKTLGVHWGWMPRFWRLTSPTTAASSTPRAQCWLNAAIRPEIPTLRRPLPHAAPRAHRRRGAAICEEKRPVGNVDRAAKPA